MIDDSTLYLIKSNLQMINYASAIVSFLIGISPLLMNREAVEKTSRPFLVELSAAFFLIFTIMLIFLDFVSTKPFFKENQCLVLKDKYENKLEFPSYHKSKVFKVISIGSDVYLLRNIRTNDTVETEIKEDFKFRKTLCN